MIKSVYPDIDVFCIDANPLCKPVLESKQYNHEIALIGDSNKDAVTFYIEKKDCLAGGASVYLENTSYYDDRFAMELPMKTLDGLHRTFDLIKIDVQGAELDVINGGMETIKTTDFIIMELSVVEYNKHAPLVNQAIQRMDEVGFCIYDVFDLHYDTFFRNNMQLLQIDFCFVNKKLKADFISKW
jgi:FkbM family methyltransferase